MNLERHSTIALDFDDTLVNGPASEFLARFIQDNPDKTYVIITHRTPRECATIPQELREFTLLTVQQFARVIPTPERLKMEFDEDQRLRFQKRFPRLSPTTPEDDLLPGEFKFLHWKGFAASKAGATVLVDDLPYLSALGCRRHHVELIDSRKLGTATMAAEHWSMRRLLRIMETFQR